MIEIKINDRVNSVYQAIVRIEVVRKEGQTGEYKNPDRPASGVIDDRDGLVEPSSCHKQPD